MKTTLFVFCCVSMFAQTRPAPAPQAQKTPPPAAQKSALDKATLESYLRHVELWIPEITVKIDDAKPSTSVPGFFDVAVHLSYNGGTKDELYYVSKDGHTVVKGDAYDINRNPFQSNLDKLKTSTQPSFGPEKAPVTLVVFSDFQCPVCKEEAQVLRENIASTFKDKVRVYFNDFPLDSIHNWARTAAIAGRCVYNQKQAAFWDFFDWTYENQIQIGMDNITGKLQQFAGEKGLDGMQLGRCVETKATEAEVDRSVAEGHLLQVSATPTIFMNGRKLEGGIPWQQLEPLINFELDHQAKAAAAESDKCCEVAIPKLVK
ncbi:MAG: thioredoxin domain-containing protein [Bryobacteraceae bacterium]|jgi:protein-disulfide isomerase